MHTKRFVLLSILLFLCFNCFPQPIKRIILTAENLRSVSPGSYCEVYSIIDLKGKKLIMPENCAIDVSRGQITNGTIVGKNTTMYSGELSLHGAKVEGSFSNELLLTYFIDARNKKEDCSRVINMLFSVQNIVHLPDYDIFVYNPINLSSGKTLTGSTQLSSVINSIGCNAIEIQEDTRYLEVSNLTLRNTVRDVNYYPQNDAIGIKFIGTYSGAQIKLTDITINSFNIGVSAVDVFWTSQIARCRFNFCNIGFLGEKKNVGSSIVNSFRDCYFNECKTYGLYLSGYNEVLIESCNFGGVTLPKERKVDTGPKAMCRLDYCKLASIIACNFESMTLNDYCSAVYCNTSTLTVKNSTFAYLSSLYIKNGKKQKTFSAAVLANYGSEVEISGYRAVKNDDLYVDILCYQNATVHADNVVLSKKTLSGGVVNITKRLY